MKIMEDVRKYAAEQGIAEEEAVKKERKKSPARPREGKLGVKPSASVCQKKLNRVAKGPSAILGA